MYLPIPGFSHLMLLAPPDPIVYKRTPTQADAATRARVAELVTLIVEVATGRRPLAVLDSDRFERAVRIHIRAWMRTHTGPKAGAQIHSLHARASGEFHGSITIGSKRHAFTGACDDHRIRAFRLL